MERKEGEGRGVVKLQPGESGGKSLVRKPGNSTLALPLQVPQVNIAINVLR